MFDFDAGKFIIIGIVALIVIGPKELPRVMRQLGQAAARMRRLAAEFRGQFMEAMREADLEDIKAEAGKISETARIDTHIDPLAEIKAGITSALEAADKPAAQARADVAAIAPPGGDQPAVNAAGMLSLPDTPAFAGAAGEPRKAPPAASEAEMQALASALAAEIGDTGGAKTDTKTQEKA